MWWQLWYSCLFLLCWDFSSTVSREAELQVSLLCIKFKVKALVHFVCMVIVCVFDRLHGSIFRFNITSVFSHIPPGWLWIQKEVLLVCSSEQSAHVSAVCALASVLQGELKATVHMALWATQTGARTGVADVGPLPWLYGQWESMRKAQGRVLIIWSPEAKTTYEKWKQRENVDTNEIKKEKGEDVQEDYELNGRRLGKGKKKKERAARKEDCVKDLYPQREACSVIAPVFAGALACLQGSLQQCRGQGVAIVYFQGFGQSRDIPKALRDVPRYCLPQNFRGLIQELGGMQRESKSKGHCWPRLFSKVQSVWLARQLAHRLQTLLRRTQGEKTQTVPSSQRKTSEKTQNRLKLSPAAEVGRQETAQEQEPLQGSPWRAEALWSQVPRVLRGQTFVLLDTWYVHETPEMPVRGGHLRACHSSATFHHLTPTDFLHIAKRWRLHRVSDRNPLCCFPDWNVRNDSLISVH